MFSRLFSRFFSSFAGLFFVAIILSVGFTTDLFATVKGSQDVVSEGVGTACNQVVVSGAQAAIFTPVANHNFEIDPVFVEAIATPQQDQGADATKPPLSAIVGAVLGVLEVVVRLFPTKRNWSILDMLSQIVGVFLPNRKPDGGVHTPT